MSTYLFKFLAILSLVILLLSCSSDTAVDFTVYNVENQEMTLGDFSNLTIVTWNSR